MAYIKSEIHFLNYIKSIARTNNISLDELCSDEWYVNNIYNDNLVDNFTWHIKTSPYSLLPKNINKVLDMLIATKQQHWKNLNEKAKQERIKQKQEEELRDKKELESIRLTTDIPDIVCLNEQEYKEVKDRLFKKKSWKPRFQLNNEVEIMPFILKLNTAGVYAFCDSNNTPLYIGSAKLLSNRILSSFNERFSSYGASGHIKLFCVLCDSEIDARIMETYFIGIYKPKLNIYCVTEENVSVNINNIPKFQYITTCVIEISNYVEKILVEKYNKLIDNI